MFLRSIIPPTLALIALCAIGTATAAGTFKWVDENGVTHYGDRIPPKYAKQQREVLNQRGDTVKVLEHEKTTEERAEDARKEELARQEKEQKRQDAILLSSYQNEADLRKSHDEQLASLDGMLKINQIALEGTEKDLNARKQREAQLVKDGKPVPPDLTRQIGILETRLAQDRNALATREKERQAIAAKFERNIVRWRQLKAASTGGSAANQGADAGVGK